MSNYAFEGPTRPAETVTWSFATSNFSPDVANGYSFSSLLSQPQYQAVVELASQRWSQVTGIAFAQVADVSTSDIRIGWGNLLVAAGGEIGETSYVYDPTTNTLLPDTLIRLEDPTFDTLTGSTATTYTYAGSVSTLYQVILHEIGHALGLAHSTDTGAIMYPVAQTTNRNLYSSDIAGIQALYGQAFAGEASITGADGNPVFVGFDNAGGAALAQRLLASAAQLPVDTGANSGTATRSTRFLGAAGSYLSHSGNIAVIDDAVGSVTLATNTASGQSIVAGDGGLILAAYGSGTVVAGGGANQIFVTAASAGAWNIALGNGANTILAATANETIAAGAGRNLIFLGTGASSVLSSGVDTIVGGSVSRDTIGVQGSGALVFGGTGGIAFAAASGVSTVVGGGGNLSVVGGAGGGIFFGGSAGGNSISGGGGPTTIVGGGAGDLLAATGGGAALIAGGTGAETIDGAGSSGANVFFAGSGPDLIVSGSFLSAVEVGIGNDTLVGGTGDSLFVFANGHAGGTDVIAGFDPSLDYFTLQGYGTNAAAGAVASAVAFNGSTFLSLAAGTKIVLAGYTGLTTQSFV